MAEAEAVMNAVRAALAGGLDWADLARMIEEEKRAGNPVASRVHSLQLDRAPTLLYSHSFHFRIPSFFSYLRLLSLLH